jgi:FMN phosphatase YigB (HAD superfamily)
MDKKIKLISFDFDGTICPNSGNVWLLEKELHKLLKKKFSLDKVTRKKRDEIRNNLSYEEWKAIKKEAQIPWMKSFNIPEEIKETLTKLSEKFTIIIFSNASREYIKETLISNGVDVSIFKEIYTTRDDFEGEMIKEPWMYKEIAKRENVDVSDCVHIGDNEYQDHQNSMEAGFRPFLIDHSNIEKISIKDLLEKI